MASKYNVGLPVGSPDDLDPSLFKLSDEEIEFVASQTGIKEREELKNHLLEVQREAYAVAPYPCIRGFYFVKLEISRYPAYQDLLELGRERKGAIFLDIGCNAGNACRKAAADGFPPTQMVASDLIAEFWDIGHKAFRSTPESFPVRFLAGDVFDDTFLAPGPISQGLLLPEPGAVELSALTSLTPLRGKVSAIHAANFFHLFNEEKQKEAAEKLASLLSPEPGSLIFGANAARADRKGVYNLNAAATDQPAHERFGHSPQSWKELWEGIFGPGKVEVSVSMEFLDVKSVRVSVPGGAEKADYMVWSVKRL